MNTVKPFKKTALGGVLLTALLVLPAYANNDRTTDVTDVSPEQKKAELAKFKSINQLGELELKLPKPVYFSTKNGVPAVFTPMKNLPIVDVSLEFATGNKHGTLIHKDLEGLAGITGAMMMHGTKTLDEEAFNEASELLAMSLAVSASDESFLVDLRSLLVDDTLDKSVAMMLDVINNPRFDGKILERLFAQAVIADRVAQQDPNYLAQRAFNGIVNKNDPKAYEGAVEKTAKLLKREHLLAYKERFLVADNAKLAITGDMSLDDAKALAERISSALPKGEKAPAFDTVKKFTPIHHHINHPSTQTVVMMGNVSPPVGKDKASLQGYYNYTAGNSILAGGDFNSRLMKEIRVKHGYTYGIGGGLSDDSERALYSLGFSVETAKASDAIARTLSTIQETLDKGVRQDELDDEKSGDKNAYPARFGTHSGVHNAVAGVFFDELPKDHLATRFERIDNADLNGVKQALNRFIVPSDFVVVTVGAEKPKVVLPKANKTKK